MSSEPPLLNDPILKEGIEPLDNLVCDICLELNLTEDIHVQKCVVCEESYCTHHTSIVDPTHCAECLHDVSVTFETIRKTETHINQLTNQPYTRTRKARSIKLGGMHWLFAQRKIDEMNDQELALAIEYHRAYYDALIYEREKRRIDNFHRNAKRAYKINQPGSSSTTVTSTTVIKKSKIVTGNKPKTQEVNLGAALQLLLKQGFTMEQIKGMVTGGKK